MNRVLIVALIALIAEAQEAHACNSRWVSNQVVQWEPFSPIERTAFVHSLNGYAIGEWRWYSNARESVGLVLSLSREISGQRPGFVSMTLLGDTRRAHKTPIPLDPDIPVTFQFDDAPIEKRAIAPHSRGFAFFDDDLISRVTATHRFVVTLGLEGHGQKKFSFRLCGLDWPKPGDLFSESKPVIPPDELWTPWEYISLPAFSAR